MKTLGIGITTCNRPHIAEFCIAQVNKHTKEFVLFVHDDKEKRGVAYSKNQCLINLKECDHIILLDDDCFPIKDGWTDFFINAHHESGQHCFNYIKPTSSFHLVKEYTYPNTVIEVFNSSGGPFLFLTKKVIEGVGGFCRDYGMYGFEHIGYTYRIYKSELNTLGAHLNVRGSDEYIYAMDFDFHLPHNKNLNFDKYQISNIGEKRKSLQHNRIVFLKEKEIIWQKL